MPDKATHDIQAVRFEVVRDEGRLAVCVLVERGRLLGRGPDVGKLGTVNLTSPGQNEAS